MKVSLGLPKPLGGGVKPKQPAKTAQPPVKPYLEFTKGEAHLQRV